jgi:hypothetical protein
MSLVDFHAHYFSRTYFHTLAGQAPGAGDAASKLARAAAAAGFEVPPDDDEAHLARWIGELDRHGVRHACFFASVPEETPIVCAAAARSGGRISAMALVNPRAPGAVERLGQALATGAARGALVFPALHHWRWDSPEARQLCEVLDHHGAILYAHCGLLVVRVRDLLGLPRTADITYADPLALVPVANAHRRVRFVIPHFGAGFLRETLLVGAQCDNVHVDTSSSNSWRAVLCPKPSLAEVLARALEVYGRERVLFGTDSNTFPAGWRRDRLEEQRRALLESGADDETLRLVLGGNAERLLGIAAG